MRKVIYIFILIFAFLSTTKAYGSGKFMDHFTWGVDAGSSIDISGNDLSSIDISAFFGYKNSIIQALGVGAGINSALGNNHALYPAFVLLRVDLTTSPSLCFIETRMGYSFNSLNTETKQDGVFGSLGVGFNLFKSSKVKSHIILAYTYSKLTADNSLEYTRFSKDLSAMSIRIGVNF